MIRNIVTVCDGAGLTGGTEKVAITSAISLAERGYRSIYFAGEGSLYPGFEGTNVEASTLGLTDAYHTESKRELLSRFFLGKIILVNLQSETNFPSSSVILISHKWMLRPL